jgi:hypothetical protein
LIRATSPGLKDATIAITTLGGPGYVAGVTPAVKPRPYVRFYEPQARRPASDNSVFGLNNPTLASSEAAGTCGECRQRRQRGDILAGE